MFAIQLTLMIVGLTAIWITAVGESGPSITRGKGTECVAETGFMRRNHMDLIKHQRDDTVLRGIRGQPFSLVECVDCHAQRDAENNYVRIDSDGQFCESCHTYVALKIDCYSCHAAVPDRSEHSTGNTK